MLDKILAAARRLVAPPPPCAPPASSADLYEGGASPCQPADPVAALRQALAPTQRRGGQSERQHVRAAFSRETHPQVLTRLMQEVMRRPKLASSGLSAVPWDKVAAQCRTPEDVTCCFKLLECTDWDTTRWVALSTLQRHLDPPLALDLLEIRLHMSSASRRDSNPFLHLNGAAFLAHPEAPALAARLLLAVQITPCRPQAHLAEAFGAALPRFVAAWPFAEALSINAHQSHALPPLQTYLEPPNLPGLNLLQRVLRFEGPAQAWVHEQLRTASQAEARLWRNFMSCPIHVRSTANVWRLLHLAFAHPQPEQSGALMQKIIDALDWAHESLFSELVQQQAELGSAKGAGTTLLLHLALRTHPSASPALYQHPRLQRLFSSPALVRDAFKARRLLQALLTFKCANVMEAIFTYPNAAQLEASLPEPLRSATAAACAAGQDILTAANHKQAVNTYYSQKVLPTLLDYAEMAAPLGPQNSALMLNSDGALRDLQELRSALQKDLCQGEPTPQMAGMLRRWRNLDGLLTYAQTLKRAADQGETLKLLQEALKQEALGNAPQWRLAQSAQMRAVRAAAPQFNQQAWSAGARVAAQDLSQDLPADWTMHDTGDINDLLNMASEGASSCQSLSSPWRNNRGLLGRLYDGSQRLIACKDSQGKIRARASLVLLRCAQNKPALFLNGVYHAPGPSLTVLKHAIMAFAQSRAAALQVPLYDAPAYGLTQGRYGTQGTPSTLHLAANCAPDYWDEVPNYGVREAGQARTFKLLACPAAPARPSEDGNTPLSTRR